MNFSVIFMVILLVLNVNGIHDSKKWTDILRSVLSVSPDILAFQETHLTTQQEYLFGCALLNYHVFYEHGISSSVGVLITIKQNRGIKICGARGKQGHFLAVECQWDSQLYKILTIYAPNDTQEHQSFFEQLIPELNHHHIVLYGNFNSVLQENDRASQQIDGTTDVLNCIIQDTNLSEPSGFSQFTYQHPSVKERKSRIDLFLVSHCLQGLWFGATHFCAYSDYQAVILFPTKQEQSGPGLW